MFFAILRYELRSLLRQKSTWIFAGIFLAFGLLFMAAAAGVIPGAVVGSSRGKVLVNSPNSLMSFTGALSVFGLLITAAVMGKAVQRDFELGTASLFGTAPVRRSAYLGGRFVASLLVLMGIYATIPLGLWLATFLPGAEADRLGPASLAGALAPLAILVLPNVLFSGSMFFALGARLRRFGPVMTAAVLLLVAYLISGQLTREIDHRVLASMLDPFGMETIHHLTRYWTAAEANSRMVPFTGVLLWNRVLWVSLGVGVSLLTLHGFRLGTLDVKPARTKRGERGTPGAETTAEGPRGTLPIVPPERWTLGPTLRQLVPSVAVQSFRAVTRTLGFRLIALGGVLVMLSMAGSVGSMFGTETFPVTYLMLMHMGSIFSLFMLIIVTIYAAELMWQEHESGMGDVFDALPTPSWALHLGRYLGLLGVVLLLLLLLAVTGMGIQLGHGYTHLEPGLWAFHLGVIVFPDLAMLAGLAFVVHLAVHHKHLGHAVMVLFYAVGMFRSKLGLDHNLLYFGSDPGLVYSDMNGYGHFLEPLLWFRTYWSAWLLLLVVAVALVVVRGRETGWRTRLSVARQRFRGGAVWSFSASAVLVAVLGSWIFFNTNVRNSYQTRFDGEADRAGYEKTYKRLEGVTQPKLTASDVRLELYPKQREATFSGTLTFLNRSDAPIDTLYVNLPTERDPVEIRVLSFDLPHTVKERDGRFGVWTVTLDTPLAPGAETRLAYTLHFAPKGIENETGWTRLVENGTFLSSGLLPALGYNPGYELTQDRVRREHGLGAYAGLPEPTDPAVRDSNYLTPHADWIDFRAVIGTAKDQIALAPGYLQREWEENGRRYFEYAMDAPILDFYSFLSARWEVRRERWNDVAIEVYFHPGHDANVDRMIASTKRSLDYFSKHFGPYQHRQVRILEFPRYQSFAQSFPNTIPYSEGLGFIAKVDPDDPDDVDYPFYVTAHEVAHQWWGHQVIGARARGTTFLSESLAQYAALMVMKQELGVHQMRRFLEHELDDYLIGRSQETREELPLSRTDGQLYIHYQKGSVALYALQDLIGEETVNAALKAFRDEWAFKGPPYPTSMDLIEALRAVTPEHQHGLIHDLLEDIILFDGRAVSAKGKALGDDRYEITLDLEVSKLRADGHGNETEVPLDDLFDIGVLDAAGAPLYLEKHRLTDKKTQLKLTVQGKPAKAGVDPFVKLVDRDAEDNTVAVEL